MRQRVPPERDEEQDVPHLQDHPQRPRVLRLLVRLLLLLLQLQVLPRQEALQALLLLLLPQPSPSQQVRRRTARFLPTCRRALAIQGRGTMTVTQELGVQTLLIMEEEQEALHPLRIAVSHATRMTLGLNAVVAAALRGGRASLAG